MNIRLPQASDNPGFYVLPFLDNRLCIDERFLQKKLIELLKTYFLHSVRYKAGEIFFHPGDTFNRLYLPQASFTRAYLISSEGEENTIHILTPIELFAYTLCSGNRNTHTYFEIMETDTVCSISRDVARTFLSENADLFAQILSLYVQTLREFELRSTTVMTGHAEKRIASVIYGLSLRFGMPKKNTIIIPFKISHRVLASFTGMKRETVSVHVSKMKSAGILRQKTHYLVIVNTQKLREMAEDSSP